MDLFLIFLFQFISGIFSCTETALVSLRDSQVEQLEQEGARGKRIAAVVRNPNKFLSAVQIGITFMGFLSASFGASSLLPFVTPGLMHLGLSSGTANGVGTVVLTLILSYFSIVFSEMVPKRIALQKNEAIARVAVPFVSAFAVLCSPLIWTISHLTNLTVRLLGFDPKKVDQKVTDDELRVIVSTNTQLTTEEREILDDVFDASETTVSEVMRPRGDMSALESTLTIEQAQKRVRHLPFSRYPVIGKGLDDIRGFIHLRDLFDADSSSSMTIGEIARPIISVPGTARLLPTLNVLRRDSGHIAIVLDEYGGTDGIVTLEDLMEELIGDIQDEYDIPETSAPQKKILPESGEIEVDAGISLDDFKELTGITLEDGPYETVAGYWIGHKGTMPKEGEKYRSPNGYTMIIGKMSGRRVQTMKIILSDTKLDGNPANSTQQQELRK